MEVIYRNLKLEVKVWCWEEKAPEKKKGDSIKGWGKKTPIQTILFSLLHPSLKPQIWEICVTRVLANVMSKSTKYLRGFEIFILLHAKFQQFEWLSAVVFQLNLKHLQLKITNLLRVVVQTNNSLICTWYLAQIPLVIFQNCLQFHSPHSSWKYV